MSYRKELTLHKLQVTPSSMFSQYLEPGGGGYNPPDPRPAKGYAREEKVEVLDVMPRS